MVRVQKLFALLHIPTPSIDKLRQGRDITYTAERCTLDLDGYWIDEKELTVMNEHGQVLVPRRTHVVDLVVKIIRNRGKGNKRNR